MFFCGVCGWFWSPDWQHRCGVIFTSWFYTPTPSASDTLKAPEGIRRGCCWLDKSSGTSNDCSIYQSGLGKKKVISFGSSDYWVQLSITEFFGISLRLSEHNRKQIRPAMVRWYSKNLATDCGDTWKRIGGVTEVDFTARFTVWCLGVLPSKSCPLAPGREKKKV